MRAIHKLPEPGSLTEYRLLAGAIYDGMPQQVKQDLRVALVQEQRGLCCYCMGRIRAEQSGMRIEHWAAKAAHPELALTYSNLLAACHGGEGDRRPQQHCDVYKGDNALNINPATEPGDFASRFIYDPTGRISSDQAPARPDLDTLNLNAAILKNNRKAVVDALLLQWRSGRGTARLQAYWGGGEVLREYCEVALYYLRKKRNWLDAHAGA